MSGKHVMLGVEFDLMLYKNYTNTIRTDLPKGNTYYAIFGPKQGEYLEKFKNTKAYKIIYESPRAVNKNTGHGYEPRNTLVIFEVADGQSS